ncbi:MAG: RES family NAD+ phosphorylase [Myxococcota bacterium]|nr:RES family NAD+ phosphorylase [Myxococcota bacterium]
MRAPIAQRVRWTHAYRVINSRYPPIDVFERIADPADWETLIALEEMTNPRARDAWGEISLVVPDERISGPGASWVMAAFTHVGRASRFTDGSYGVYYAARLLETSVRETTFHFGRFLLATLEPRGTELEMRVLVSSAIDSTFHDIRDGHDELHDPDDYATPQRVAKRLREQGANGIVYRSVRHLGGDHPCLAVFRPKTIPRPKQGAHLRYHFDGTRIDRWFQIGKTKWETLS